MSSKIIFFDIDGTILSHRNFRILDSTKAAIKQARENGHLTFINTGRTFSEIEDEIKDVGFDGYVCGCGTYIYLNSSVLFKTSIDRATRQMLIKDLRKYKLEAVLEGNSAIYFDSKLRNVKLKSVHDMFKRRNFNVLNWDDPNIKFEKFCLWLDTSESHLPFYNKYDSTFDFIKRDEPFLEVVPKGYSKATGIEYLLSHLNIPHENAYALGDSANDFSMLSYVKHSIGMGNSEDEIKNLVSYITKDVDEDGVAHALKHFNII
ncbi:MAG: HAD family hydrolase [Herbinix sp.]|nr:HAD family hydrolase [Herbinix sp.]